MDKYPLEHEHYVNPTVNENSMYSEGIPAKLVAHSDMALHVCKYQKYAPSDLCELCLMTVLWAVKEGCIDYKGQISIYKYWSMRGVINIRTYLV